MYKNGEIEEVMKDFEKFTVSNMCTARCRLDREKREIGEKFMNGKYYEDGETNNIFLGWLHGYASGKLASRLELT